MWPLDAKCSNVFTAILCEIHFDITKKKINAIKWAMFIKYGDKENCFARNHMKKMLVVSKSGKY